MNLRKRLQIKRHIDASGYSWRELAKIEAAFESMAEYDDGDNDINIDQSMFNGLMAVVDVLAEIHEISLETTNETKKLFVKI